MKQVGHDTQDFGLCVEIVGFPLDLQTWGRPDRGSKGPAAELYILQVRPHSCGSQEREREFLGVSPKRIDHNFSAVGRLECCSSESSSFGM